MTIAEEIELEPLRDPGGGGPLSPAWPFLGTVKVRLSVRVGAAEVTIAQLLDTKQGGIIALDRLLEEPLDVLVGEHVVARGVLVAVGEHFGLQITQTATAGES